MSSNHRVNIDHLAKLARIELTDEEKDRFAREVGQVVEYFSLLQQVDVDGVEPTAHARVLYNVMREDSEGTCQDPNDTLANAPATIEEQLIEVPPVIDDGSSA